MRWFGFAALMVLVAGCASKGPVDPRIAEVAAGVTKEKTSFDVYKKYQGPEHKIENFEGYTLIRSWQDPYSTKSEHQLYVHVIHDGREKVFLSASQPGGKLMDLKRIDSGRECADGQSGIDCPLYEDIGVWLDNDMLRQASKEQGIVLRMNAKRGEDVIVRVPAWYLKGYLSEIKR